MNTLKANPEVLEEYTRMLAECKLIIGVNFNHYSNDLKVTPLIISSFSKYAVDIGSNERLNTTEIISLTELQLQPSSEPQSL